MNSLKIDIRLGMPGTPLQAAEKIVVRVDANGAAVLSSSVLQGESKRDFPIRVRLPIRFRVGPIAVNQAIGLEGVVSMSLADES